MKNLNQFVNTGIQILFTDIDDTLTERGQLKDDAYTALWNLNRNGIKIVPVTGRPAGWCEMIARTWPVHGVIGENGAFYFRYEQKKMKRFFSVGETERRIFRKKLDEVLGPEILRLVPGSALASDQFCRLTDLAIDYCEDVSPLEQGDVAKIVKLFEKYGAHAKVSSIHVNGWFGEFNKVITCKTYASQELGIDLDSTDGQNKSCFVGDSPNDEPSFELFQNSFGVANISKFADQMKFKPKYVASHEGGAGFVEISKALLKK